MADFNVAIDVVFAQTASCRKPDSHANDFPGIYGYGYSVRAVTLDKRIYRNLLWRPLLLDGCRNQDVATKILDLAIGLGPYVAVRLLQAALNTLHSTLLVNGVMDADTLGATNGADSFELLTELRANATGFYHAIVDCQPEKFKIYWPEWRERAAR